MEALLLAYKTKGVTKVIFGDIFLEDLREYREKNLAKVGLNALFTVPKVRCPLEPGATELNVWS